MRLGKFCAFTAMGVMALLLFTPGVPLRAQALYGSIVGTVVDASGAVVPGAAVKATDTGTGQVRETLTNDTGAYTFPTLVQGTYDVSVGKQGFETFIRQGVTVATDSVVRVDVKMTVGSTSESVTVSAQAAQLQTDKA